MRPASEPIETIRPDPRSIMWSSTARVALMKPHMSMAISRSHSSRGFSMNRRSTVQPAQLTSTSTPPSVSIAWSIVARHLVRVGDVGAALADAAPPDPAAITASACASSTSAISTRAPSSAKPSVRARPMFEAPPVITHALAVEAEVHQWTTSGAIWSVSTRRRSSRPPPSSGKIRSSTPVAVSARDALHALVDRAGDRQRAHELVADRALVPGARREVLAVVVVLLRPLDLRAEGLEARRQLLHARLQARLRARPRADVGQRGLAVLARRQRGDEADADVGAAAAGLLDALGDPAELAGEDVRLGGAHDDHAVGEPAGEAAHARLADREVDRSARHLLGEPVAAALPRALAAVEHGAEELEPLLHLGHLRRPLAQAVDGGVARAEAQQRAAAGQLGDRGDRVRGHGRVAGDEVADAGAEAHRLGLARGEREPDVGVLHRELRVDQPQLLDAALLELAGEARPVGERLARADPDRDADAHQALSPRDRVRDLVRPLDRQRVAGVLEHAHGAALDLLGDDLRRARRAVLVGVAGDDHGRRGDGAQLGVERGLVEARHGEAGVGEAARVGGRLAADPQPGLDLLGAVAVDVLGVLVERRAQLGVVVLDERGALLVPAAGGAVDAARGADQRERGRRGRARRWRRAWRSCRRARSRRWWRARSRRRRAPRSGRRRAGRGCRRASPSGEPPWPRRS